MAKKLDLADGQRSSGGGPLPPHTTTPIEHPPVAAPPKLRRRPLLALAGLALVIIGALAAVWIYLMSSEAVEAVAVRETVMRGDTIEAGDLMMVRVTPDPALQLVPGAELESFVGQRAARDLSAGALVTREAVLTGVLDEDMGVWVPH